ncbi:MAG: GNAT family N-acetyltransferase [Chloroflexota bacterium]|nr:GNAT family N-acetyltransferase [Chloroflexota bacterium]
MTQIDFRPADKANYEALARLTRTMTPEQQTFVAHNAFSMLEAIYYPETLFALGMYEGDTPVGFTLYGVDPDTREWWIVRFMIAGTYQRKGYGRAAILKLIEHIRTQHGADAIKISFVPANTPARDLYLSVGFVDTGVIDEGESVYRLPKPDAAGE